MSPQKGLIPNEQLQEETDYQNRVLLINEETDDGGWITPPEMHPAFGAIITNFYALLTHDGKMELRYIDPYMKREDKAAAGDVGLYEHTWGSARVTLNWTAEWKGTGKTRIPPRHVMIHWGDIFCGVLGAFLHARQCYDFTCGAMTAPDGPCHKCGKPDWVTMIITPEHIVQVLAEALAKQRGRDELWEMAEGAEAERAAKAGEPMG